MSLSCLGHGWARAAGPASATLLGIGELWLVSGPAEEAGCCCRYEAWRAWCPHQECHRKQTSGAGGGRGGWKGVQKESECHCGHRAWNMPCTCQDGQSKVVPGPRLGSHICSGTATWVHSWIRAPPDTPSYWKPCLRAAGVGESKHSHQNHGEPLPNAMPF